MRQSYFTELRPGLFRWTARHPAAVPGAQPESPDDWPADVGCVACRAPGALVLVDPLVPAGHEAELWAELDALVGPGDLGVVVLTTIEFHSRSRDDAIERYGATAGAPLPSGVSTIPIAGAGETMVWLEEHRALVPGDRLMGDGQGGLRMCPESWLGYLGNGMTLAGLRSALEPVRDLPVEMVLVSHGEPVLSRGRAAIERALA